MSTAMGLFDLSWGERKGWVFLSVRDSRKPKEDPDYWHDLAFRWPRDRGKVKGIIQKARHSRKDVYWAPGMFKSPRRQGDNSQELDTLWADLDEVEPNSLPYEPSAIWETSPDHYQAVWKMDKRLPPEEQRELNQRLTYAIGADKGGWDLGQVLRIPGTPNHKYQGVRVGKAHINGAAAIKPSDLLELPAPDTPVVNGEVEPVELEPPDIVLRRHKGISARAKQLLKAKPNNAVEGMRSERLWELECLLAEAGLAVAEIVSLARSSVWNKHSHKPVRTEIRQLSAEAAKAISKVAKRTDQPPVVTAEGTDGDASDELSRPIPWATFDKDHAAVEWLVADVWGSQEVGFVSGLPKTYKSWFTLDLGVSVATGTYFLGSFACKKRNVLLIQEEDPKAVLQDRLIKIASAKDLVWVKSHGDFVEIKYELPENLYIISNQGFQITSDEWLESVVEWIEEMDIGLVIMDPLMMMAEGVDEFKAFEMMNAVLKPLKRLRADTQASVVLVHHHTKQASEAAAKSMYGSVAFWAWEESGLHLNVQAPGRVAVERFSKHTRLFPVTVEVGDTDKEWRPQVQYGVGGSDLMDLFTQYEEGLTMNELIEMTKMGRDALDRETKKLVEEEKIEKRLAPRVPGQRGRRQTAWRIVR